MSNGRPDTRLAIIEACLRLLERTDAKPITFEEVATAAGVSRQGVYLHFSNKADLLVAVVDHQKKISGLEAALQDARGAQGFDAALDALIDIHVRFTPLLFPTHRAVALERLRDPAVEAAWESRDSSRINHLRALMDLAATEGRLAEGWTASEAADLFWAVTAPALTEDLIVRRGWTPKRVGRRIRDVIENTMLQKRKGKKK